VRNVTYSRVGPGQELNPKANAAYTRVDLGQELNPKPKLGATGILIDAIPESMVIGFIVAEGSRNPLVFVVCCPGARTKPST
jgi:hypothetical protein